MSNEKAQAAIDAAQGNVVTLDRAQAGELLDRLINDWRQDNAEAKGGLYGAIARGEVPHIAMLLKALGRSTDPEAMESCHMPDEDVLALLKDNPLEKGSITGFGRAVAEAQRELCARFVQAGIVTGLDDSHAESRKLIADAMRLEKKA